MRLRRDGNMKNFTCLLQAPSMRGETHCDSREIGIFCALAPLFGQLAEPPGVDAIAEGFRQMVKDDFENMSKRFHVSILSTSTSSGDLDKNARRGKPDSSRNKDRN